MYTCSKLSVFKIDYCTYDLYDIWALSGEEYIKGLTSMISTARINVPEMSFFKTYFII